MSHTDKTRPYWVQILDPVNKGWIQEYHNHTDGVCDITYGGRWREFAAGRWNSISITRRTCWWEESHHAYRSGLFPRPSKRGWTRYRGREGVARARLRAQVHEWRKLKDWVDIDDREFEPTQARLWHNWG